MKTIAILLAMKVLAGTGVAAVNVPKPETLNEHEIIVSADFMDEDEGVYHLEYFSDGYATIDIHE